MSDAITKIHPKCSICRHAQRPAIDLALGTTGKVNAIATQFQVGISSLERHKRTHLRPALERAAEVREQESGSVLDQLRDLCAKAHALVKRAEEEKAPIRDGAAAIREARATLETIGKLLGEFRDDAPRDNRRQILIFQNMSTEDLLAIARLDQPR